MNKKVKFLIIILIIIIALICLGVFLLDNKSINGEKYTNKYDYLYDIAIDYMKNEDIEEYNPDKNKDNYHFFVNYDKFGITKKGKYKYAYMWILGEGYYLEKGKQEISNGYSMFFKFTFENDKVIKYELPKDGTLYLDSIREMCIDKNMFNKVSNYIPELSNEQSIKEYYSNVTK